MPEALAVTDSRIDPDRFILADIDTSAGPLFTVSEVAKFFFARTAHWVRWRERRSFFVLDGAKDCLHEEAHEVPEHTNETGKVHKAKTDYITWITDGFCKACGGRAVGNSRTPEGARRYSLADVEEIAHALAERGAISGSQLRNTLTIVQAVARNAGYL
jgi:hypothetical protein